MGTLLPGDSLREPDPPASGKLERIVFAGRLAPEKRVHTIIEAARQLPEIGFTIAGDGPLKKDVEDQAAEIPNLDFLGWVSRERLLAEMDKADMLVLNSVVESFGTVALEAMARVAALPPGSRTAAAKSARKAALRLNRGSLLHWLDVIRSAEESSVAGP